MSIAVRTSPVASVHAQSPLPAAASPPPLSTPRDLCEDRRRVPRPHYHSARHYSARQYCRKLCFDGMSRRRCAVMGRKDLRVGVSRPRSGDAQAGRRPEKDRCVVSARCAVQAGSIARVSGDDWGVGSARVVVVDAKDARDEKVRFGACRSPRCLALHESKASDRFMHTQSLMHAW